jgi:hypothetical protein
LKLCHTPIRVVIIAIQAESVVFVNKKRKSKFKTAHDVTLVFGSVILSAALRTKAGIISQLTNPGVIAVELRRAVARGHGLRARLHARRVDRD